MTTFPDPNPSPPRLDLLLEIKLYRTTAKTYEVELELDNLSSQGQFPPVRGPAQFDPAALVTLRPRAHDYGEALAGGLFKHPGILAYFQLAKVLATERLVNLRINLIIDPSAPELHALAWELLNDPETHARISNNQGTPFSRFLYGRDNSTLPPLREGQWKALIAIPDPKFPNDYYANPINVKDLITQAESALKGTRVTVMTGPVTLDALVKAIAAGVDVLYLVCHGAVHPPQNGSTPMDFESGFGPEEKIARERDILLPVIYLENIHREAVPVPAGALARQLADLGQLPRPRLAVLASCESAGEKDDWTGISAQAALAPRLAEAGIPAIIAMQGKISVKTADAFMPEFFTEVVKHGSIDRAMAAARRVVLDRPDSWMPALFSRLKHGRLWYKPSFSPGAKWDIARVVKEIEVGSFTPIIGWGLAEKVYGTKSDLSARLATERKVPFQPHRRNELALVSQYLKLAPDGTTPLDALKERMRREVLDRFDGRLQGDVSKLSAVLRQAGALLRENERDPYRIVAQLPATVFINSCQDGLLEEALKAAGKKPIVRSTQWRLAPTTASAEALNPSVEAPLILHVFGHFAEPDSLVLGEDDYLDYLMGVAQNQALVSNAVKNALTNKALMFLGFNLTDWSFRVLFRIVLRLMAGAQVRQEGKPNVAVQVEPDSTLFSGPEEAKDFLQRFYGPSNIESYWGTSEDFLTELWPKVKPIVDNWKSGDY